MSKAKPTTKSKILLQVATLLDKFSDRLAKTARETRQNADAIAALQDQSRINVGGLSQRITAVDAKNDDREARQILRDQNNVQSLVNLRDSATTAFNQVKKDVETLLTQIQRLNERVGQADSKASNALAQIVSVGMHLTAHKVQIGSNELPQGHVWVNKKLAGVYDTTDDLETRLKKLEAIIVLYENLRKAQLALVEVNGAFLAGPKA